MIRPPSKLSRYIPAMCASSALVFTAGLLVFLGALSEPTGMVLLLLTVICLCLFADAGI